jgi:hypothetical protein
MPRSGTDAESLHRAEQILQANGVDSSAEYRVTRLVRYESGGGMVWVKRLYEGVPIFRDEIAFHFTADEQLRRTGGRPFIGGEADRVSLSGDLVPALDAETAKSTFAARAKVIELTDSTGQRSGTLAGPDFGGRLAELDAELGIYAGELAWLVCDADTGAPYGYFSARTGAVLYFDSGVRADGP